MTTEEAIMKDYEKLTKEELIKELINEKERSSDERHRNYDIEEDGKRKVLEAKADSFDMINSLFKRHRL